MEDETLVLMLQECGASGDTHSRYTDGANTFILVNGDLNVTKLADLLDDYFREKFDLNPVPSYPSSNAG